MPMEPFESSRMPSGRCAGIRHAKPGMAAPERRVVPPPLQTLLEQGVGSCPRSSLSEYRITLNHAQAFAMAPRSPGGLAHDARRNAARLAADRLHAGRGRLRARRGLRAAAAHAAHRGARRLRAGQCAEAAVRRGAAPV
ncbi:hypothetical protein BCEN4_990002 [Burkholderia cenocepacia]|nr:hypothetical protein BCEN4_990002 [Burkholderia cenocepacia]